MEIGRTEDFDYEKIKELEAELDDIHNKRTKGSQIRSKAQWIEDGEKERSTHHIFKIRKAAPIIKCNIRTQDIKQ